MEGTERDQLNAKRLLHLLRGVIDLRGVTDEELRELYAAVDAYDHDAQREVGRIALRIQARQREEEKSAAVAVESLVSRPFRSKTPSGAVRIGDGRALRLVK